MIKLGITGGIGSGKSVVADLFRLNGVPVYNADIEAKRLNDTSEVIREKLTANFGNSLYKDGKLDRREFAQIIFSDPQNLEIANAIIHPEVKHHFWKWSEAHSEFPIVALDAPLLFEAKYGDILDKIITVYAPREMRLARASVRDNVSESTIAERAKHQLPDEIKIKLSDFVIYNDNRQSLIFQIHNILKQIKIE